MSGTGAGNVESLLSREARVGLPFARLVRIYLDPSSLFMDARRGRPQAREQALTYNRRMRWILTAYIRRWGVMATVSLLAVGPAQSASTLLAATCALSAILAVAVTSVTAAAYWLLAAHSD